MPFPITCGACKKAFSIADDVFDRKVRGRVVTIKCKQCQAEIRVDGAAEPPVYGMFQASAVARAAVGARRGAEPAAKARPLTAGGSSRATGSGPQASASLNANARTAPGSPQAKAFTSPGAVRPSPMPGVPRVAVLKAGSTASSTLAVNDTAGGAAPALVSAAALPTKAPDTATSAPAVDAVASVESGERGGPETEPDALANGKDDLWAVDNPDGEDRELTLKDIERELAAGRVNLNTLVWREGMAEWSELGQVPELRGLATPSQGVQPREPTMPQAEDFALTLPEATLPILPPHAVRAPYAPSAAPVPSDADQGVAPVAPLAAEPFEPAADAPAPPAPPRVGLGPAAAVAPTASVEEWPKKSRAPLVIAGIASLTLGGIIFFLTRPAPERTVPTPISALPASPPSAPHADSEPAASTSGEPTNLDTDPDRESHGSDSASAPSPGSIAALQPPTSSPSPGLNAGFAEMFANGARGADGKTAAPPSARRFDPNLAKVALANAAAGSAACSRAGHPGGKATVVVTFEPSGNVSNAVVKGGPLAGTPTGECIAAAMRKATVPPFSGAPGTAVKVVSLQ